MDLEFAALVIGIAAVAIVILATQCKFFVVVQSGTCVVMERLGKFQKTLDGGLHFVVPIIDRPKRVHWSRTEEIRTGTRTETRKQSYHFSAIPITEQVHDLPEFRSSTSDRIDVFVNGIIFFRVADAKKAVYNINDLYSAIENLVETAIRQFTSTATLEETFVSRDKLMAQVLSSLNDCEDSWGVKVLRFDIQEINCSPQVRQATETAVLKKREAEARMVMAEANKRSQLLEMEAENEVNFSRSRAQAEMQLNKAEMQRKLAAINNQMALEETENRIKQQQMQEMEQCKFRVRQMEAEAEGLQKLLAVDGIDADYLRHRNQLEAWGAMAANQNNKIVLPYNSVPLLGAQSLLHSLCQDQPATASTPKPE